MFRFEKLDVWQVAVDFAAEVYRLSESFPARERFDLVSQIRRSAVSISANVAEGSSRSSDRDFSRFVEIAYGSLCETVSHLRIAQTQSFVSDSAAREVYDAAEGLGRMLTAFRNRLGEWKTVSREVD